MPLAASTQLHTGPAGPVAIDLGFTPEQAFAAWPAGRPLMAVWSGGPVTERARWTVLASPGRATEFCRGFRPSLRPKRAKPDPSKPPFNGGWIGMIKYEQGLLHERSTAGDLGIGKGTTAFRRCEDALIYYRLAGQGWRLANPPELDMNQAARTFAAGPISRAAAPQEYQAKVSRVLEYIRAGAVYT